MKKKRKNWGELSNKSNRIVIGKHRARVKGKFKTHATILPEARKYTCKTMDVSSKHTHGIIWYSCFRFLNAKNGGGNLCLLCAL